MSALSSESHLFPGFADLEFAVSGASTKLMNLADGRRRQFSL
jgi:hypothetical protein